MRSKKPSQYVQQIHTSEGTATGVAGNTMLPPGMPEAMMAEITDANCRGDNYAMATCIEAGVEPKNKAEAHTSPDWPHWEEAMCREIAELRGKKTWEVISLPQSANIIGSRWTYHLKHNANGAIVCYKARLVAQGFTQSFGMDYNETYAPVAKFTSTCCQEWVFQLD